jgi:DNA-binding NarL/FixJ family response regulator
MFTPFDGRSSSLPPCLTGAVRSPRSRRSRYQILGRLGHRVCFARARELDIFTLLASGKTNHDIARELSLSTNTVHNRVVSILAKLHLENRIQAAVQAVRSGIS